MLSGSKSRLAEIVREILSYIQKRAERSQI